MRIAVLMTCYNRVGTTIRSVEALERAATGFPHDVFLVDDASPDNTGVKVKERFPFINVIRGNGSLYWAKGMRFAWETAAKHGDYDFYLWLNDDLILKPDAIDNVLTDQRKIKGVIVGACSENASEMTCSYGVTDAKDRLIQPSGEPQMAQGWLNGNFVLIPNDVFKKVGYISNDYAHARADYDYAERLKKMRVPFYCSSKYVGICRNDSKKEIAGRTLIKRIGLLWAPGYYNMHDLWLIRSRYHGVVRAVLSCLYLIWIVIRGS